MDEPSFEKGKLWGMSMSLDLYKCNPDTIRDADKIKEYVKELCDNVIDMKRYGECQVVHFGDDPKVTGFSMTQLIETSLVSPISDESPRPKPFFEIDELIKLPPVLCFVL